MLRLLFYILIIFCSNFANSAELGPKIIDTSIFNTTANDAIYGSEDAPIQVLEYFSLTCPHCENFFVNIFPQLKREYIDTGKVRWIKRSYITDNASLKGTIFLHCVDKKDYDKYLRILLTKQASWAYQKDSISVLRNISTLGGMSIKKFNDCLENKKITEEVTEISEKARNLLDIAGTPAFYVNQEKVSVYSYKGFKDHLDKLLIEHKSK